MKVTLVPTPTFDVVVGNTSMPGFRLSGEWEGFWKLVDATGRALIISRDIESPAAEAFADILNPQRSVQVDVIKASPAVLAELATAAGWPAPADRRGIAAMNSRHFQKHLPFITDADGPFCDTRSLMRSTGLSEEQILAAADTRRGLERAVTRDNMKRGPRLVAKRVRVGPGDAAMVFLYADVASWLCARSESINPELADAVAADACQRLANRIAAGSRERTHLAKAALRGARVMWPAFGLRVRPAESAT